MKVCFLASDKSHERILADAFSLGVRQHGDDVTTQLLAQPIEVVDCDVAVMVGVKSRELFQAYAKAGTHIVYMDKGYSRHRVPDSPVRVWEYWRVAVDSHQPTHFLRRAKHDSSRWDRLKISVSPWRRRGRQVILAGSSAKYHEFYGLWEPTRYWNKVVQQVRLMTDREIIYRPKPTWKGAEPIHGTTFSRQPERISDVLKGAHVLVTHGSNACFEALTEGVPCIVLGEAVALFISSNTLEELEHPLMVCEEMRQQLFNNLAFCQWTMPEMASGEAWATIRPQIFGA